MEVVLNDDVVSSIKPIRDIIHSTLRQAIINGQIKPGERIVEKDYAEKFNISRTPVREALRKLEIEGLVEYIPRKGVVVKDLDIREIKEIYTIRQNLECLAIKYTIENITGEELNHLHNLVEKMEAAENTGDIDKVFETCKEFNDAILAASKMPKLVGLINSLQECIERNRRITMSGSIRRKAVISEHKAIFNSIVEKDEEKAQKIILNHIEKSKRALLEYLRADIPK